MLEPEDRDCLDECATEIVGGYRLSRDQIVRIVIDRLTLPQREALLSLDPGGRKTAIDRRHKHALTELRRLRLDPHLMVELVLPEKGSRCWPELWFTTALGRVVHERLERVES